MWINKILMTVLSLLMRVESHIDCLQNFYRTLEDWLSLNASVMKPDYLLYPKSFMSLCARTFILCLMGVAYL